LFKVGEPLAIRLATLNNLKFYLGLMKNIRSAIADNKLNKFRYISDSKGVTNEDNLQV